jgi:isoleucyl-tRNA synthetase
VFLSSAEELVRLVGRPNFRNLGPRFGKRTQAAADAIRALPQEALAAYREGSAVEVEVDGVRHALQTGDLEVAQEASGGLVVKAEGRFTVALDPALDDELRAEGLARELVNRIQRLRKDAGLEITDRIELAVEGPEALRSAAEAHRAFLSGETLAVAVEVGDVGALTSGEGFPHVRDVDLDGLAARIALRAVSA